ncbi:MAG TPA: hypothetical protein VF772_20990 [Terriglobales bacterium]
MIHTDLLHHCSNNLSRKAVTPRLLTPAFTPLFLVEQWQGLSPQESRARLPVARMKTKEGIHLCENASGSSFSDDQDREQSCSGIAGLGRCATASPFIPRPRYHGPRTRDEPKEIRQNRQPQAGAVEGTVANLH